MAGGDDSARCFSLLLFDLDGTLLRPDRTIHPRTLDTLRRLMDEGVLLSLATGRSPRSTSEHAGVLVPNAPLIHFNGGLVRDFATGEVIASHKLPLEDALAALAVGSFTGLHANLYIGDEIFIARRTPVSEASEAKDGVPHTVVGDLVEHLEALGEEPWKLLFIGEPELFEPFADEVRRAISGEVAIVNSEPDYFEVLPAGVSKATGARELASHLDLSLAEVIAFGDNKNDLELLAACGLGVAMGNSERELLERADIVIDRNDTDAIAFFLESEFLPHKGRLIGRALKP